MQQMKMLKILSFNIALFIVLLLVVEFFFRLSYPNYHYYYRTHPGQPDLQEVLSKKNSDWLKIDEDLGWVCQQKNQLHFPSPPTEGEIYQINKEGFRIPFDLTEIIPEEKKKVLLIGDSFMFGIYLNEQETITAHLNNAKGENYVFYTIAVPAWGVDQMYLAYQKYVDMIQPDQVVLAFIDDDIMRTQEILFHGCGRKPCLKIEDGQLVANNDNPAFWEYFCWNNQIGNRLLVAYYQHKAAKLCEYFFSDIIKREALLGRKPAFIRIPAKVDLDNKVPRSIFSMQELMHRESVPYKELFDPIYNLGKAKYEQYYIPDDGHPTAMGAKMLAREITPMIN